MAENFGFPVRVIHTREFEDPQYLANPENRCYFCKNELFTQLAPVARAEGFQVIAYGENASDVGDIRPGAKAAAEFRVQAPLKEVGLTKVEIREISSGLGLPTADKPQMACLSSRVPYGDAVTPQKLSMIERAENILRDFGFTDLRVRHHELRNPQVIGNGLPSTSVSLARIEVGVDQMRQFLEDGIAARVAEAFKRIGYAHVTLDLQGYRRGSTNEVLAVSHSPGSKPTGSSSGLRPAPES